MLKSWQSHVEFGKTLVSSIHEFWPYHCHRILFHAEALDKVWPLNLKTLKVFLLPYYSSTGRPARRQVQILRSLVLMVHYRVFSLDAWVARLKGDPVPVMSPVQTPSITSWPVSG